jgi:hypothetical protein
MNCKYRTFLARVAMLTAASPAFFAAEPASLEERLNALEAQNQLLRQELTEQKQTIRALQSRLETPARLSGANDELDSPPSATGGFKLGRLHLSGEGGIALFHTSSDGQHPDGSFRVDEAKLFLEAPLWESTYFFGELDLVIREANDEFFHLGELYVDFENVLRHWADRNFLSIRAGRIDIPFGEEYLVRDVIDNPLISHSLSDFWGIDEGVELYGSAFGVDYVVAVQNGGHPTLQDFDGDKSVAGRIGYNFGKRARVSVSGLRTGELSTEGDEMSELWFGNGFFRSLGSEETAPTFQANVFELDAQTFWNSGHVKLAGGYFEYEDSDTTVDRTRDGYYYYAEALQNITPKFYTVGRFSQIIADEGMPIVGYGDFGKYFFGPLTRDLWRLSLGLGYRWSENLVAKVEYTREEGDLVGGAGRDNHFVGAEIGFKF